MRRPASLGAARRIHPASTPVRLYIPVNGDTLLAIADATMKLMASDQAGD